MSVSQPATCLPVLSTVTVTVETTAPPTTATTTNAATPATTMATLEYDVLAWLGDGGFAQVFWVRESFNHTRRYAVKVVHLSSPGCMPLWLLREIDMLRHLDHDRIVKCHHAIITPMAAFIFMDAFLVSLSDVMSAISVAQHPGCSTSDLLREEPMSSGLNDMEHSAFRLRFCDIKLQEEQNPPNNVAVHNGMPLHVTSRSVELRTCMVAEVDPIWMQMKGISSQLISFVRQKVVVGIEAWLIELNGQLLDALRYLHQVHGRIHGDIKPTNVLFDLETGQIKLIDFGMCKRIYQPHTRHTMLPPTCNYAGPEFFPAKITTTTTVPRTEPAIPLHAVDPWSVMVTITNLLKGYRFLYDSSFPTPMPDVFTITARLLPWIEQQRPQWALESYVYLTQKRWLTDPSECLSRARAEMSKGFSATSAEFIIDTVDIPPLHRSQRSFDVDDHKQQLTMFRAFALINDHADEEAVPPQPSHETSDRRKQWILEGTSLWFKSLWRDHLHADPLLRPSATTLLSAHASTFEPVSMSSSLSTPASTSVIMTTSSNSHIRSQAERFHLDGVYLRHLYQAVESLHQSWQCICPSSRQTQLSSVVTMPAAATHRKFKTERARGTHTFMTETEPESALLCLSWVQTINASNKCNVTRAPCSDLQTAARLLISPYQDEYQLLPQASWSVLQRVWLQATPRTHKLGIDHVPHIELLQRLCEMSYGKSTRRVSWPRQPETASAEWQWTCIPCLVSLHLLTVVWLNQVQSWFMSPKPILSLIALLCVADDWVRMATDRRRRRSQRAIPLSHTRNTHSSSRRKREEEEDTHTPSVVLTWALSPRGHQVIGDLLQPFTFTDQSVSATSNNTSIATAESWSSVLPRIISNWHSLFAREWRKWIIPQMTTSFMDTQGILPAVFSDQHKTMRS